VIGVKKQGENRVARGRVDVQAASLGWGGEEADEGCEAAGILKSLGLWSEYLSGVGYAKWGTSRRAGGEKEKSQSRAREKNVGYSKRGRGERVPADAGRGLGGRLCGGRTLRKRGGLGKSLPIRQG